MKNLQRAFWALVYVALMSGVTSSAFAATFMKIDGIKGEATDRGHKGWIEIEIKGWGSVAGTPSNGPVGGGSGSVSVVKAFDKASPKINEACATGKNIKNVKIQLEKSAGNRMEYFKYKLKDVIISGCSQGGDGTSESFSLNYEKIEWTYDKGAKDGSKRDGAPR
jgi:type VI secretion system Hcp family effector